MRSRYEGIQNYIMHANESCFFLCLLSVAEEYLHATLDFLDTVRPCMDKGWLLNDFTVADDCRILTLLTGRKVTKEVVQDVGFVKGNQYTIEKWVWGDRTHSILSADNYSDSDALASVHEYERIRDI